MPIDEADLDHPNSSDRGVKNNPKTHSQLVILTIYKIVTRETTEISDQLYRLSFIYNQYTNFVQQRQPKSKYKFKLHYRVIFRRIMKKGNS